MRSNDSGRAEAPFRAGPHEARARWRWITAGTDAFAPWMLGIDVASMAAVAGGLVWRILPRATMTVTPVAPRAIGTNGG